MSVPLYALAYAVSGDRQKVFKYIDILRRGEKAGAMDPTYLADAYAALGDSRAALEILRRAATARDSGLLYLKVDPFLQTLRNNVEFQGLIREIGL